MGRALLAQFVVETIVSYLTRVLLQLFVGGLDSDVTDELLRQTFSQCGEVVSVKIPAGKGCGFVQFANRCNFVKHHYNISNVCLDRI